MKNTRQKFLSLVIMLSLLFSSFGSIKVYADDAAPTPEGTEEAIAGEGSYETPAELQRMEEEAGVPATVQDETEPGETETPVVEGEANTPEATAEPSDPTEEATTEDTIKVTEEVESTQEPTAVPTPLPDEELDSLPEILENVPEGTDVVVLDGNGVVEPLASEEAAKTLVEGDPIWCMNGYAPDPSDTDHCTPSFTSFSALIAELSSGSYSGDGTIWVAYDYAVTEDNDTILFDGSDANLSGISSNSLTIQGGWNGNSGSTALETPTSVSNIDVALVIDYWNGDVTMRNIFINNTTDNDAGVGLYIDTDGDVTLHNIEVSGTTGTLDPLDGDGAVIGASGNVQITDSTFDNNDGYGLDVISAGSIEVDNTSASDNILLGAYLDTYLGGLGSGSVSVTGNSIFSGNGSVEDHGLLIESYGSTNISDVTADNNGLVGILIERNGSYDKSGTVNINNVSVSNNLFGFVVQQYADGEMNILNLDARTNYIGAEIYAMDGKVNISSSVFTDNMIGGVYLETYGNITLNQVTAGSTLNSGGNGIIGMEIFSPDGKISIRSSSFSNNGEIGLVITNQKSITLIDVTADNNSEVNLLVDSTFPPKSCYCPCTVGIMRVKGGSFANSGIGIEIYAYESDKLILGTGVDEPYFNNNRINIFYDLLEIPECENCDCDCGTVEEKDGKPYKIIGVPDGGSGNIPQECGIYAGTILQLADGSFIQVSCPFDGFSSLKRISESELPGNLQPGDILDIGILLGLLGEDGSYVINSDGTITITFTIPADKRDHKHRLLFWDTTMNAGQGGWFEMPEHHFEGSIALHPDDPEDPRRIFSGVRLSRDTLTVTVNFAGYFLLVSE